jgi:hypothetical protein
MRYLTMSILFLVLGFMVIDSGQGFGRRRRAVQTIAPPPMAAQGEYGNSVNRPTPNQDISPEPMTGNITTSGTSDYPNVYGMIIDATNPDQVYPPNSMSVTGQPPNQPPQYYTWTIVFAPPTPPVGDGYVFRFETYDDAGMNSYTIDTVFNIVATRDGCLPVTPFIRAGSRRKPPPGKPAVLDVKWDKLPKEVYGTLKYTNQSPAGTTIYGIALNSPTRPSMVIPGLTTSQGPNFDIKFNYNFVKGQTYRFLVKTVNNTASARCDYTVP